MYTVPCKCCGAITVLCIFHIMVCTYWHLKVVCGEEDDRAEVVKLACTDINPCVYTCLSLFTASRLSSFTGPRPRFGSKSRPDASNADAHMMQSAYT